METVKLYNNVEVPVLGIGTFMISPEDTEKSVYAALKLGYRMIDTANAYMNEEAVGKALKKGDTVQLVGFGTFAVTKRAARKGFNPRTGEAIKIASAKVPKFKPGKALKELVGGKKK